MPPKTSPTFFVRSSIDGFVGNLATMVVTGATADGVYSSLNADLTGVAFQNLTGPIEFRISVVDGSTSTDLVNRFDNVVLNGAVAAGS